MSDSENLPAEAEIVELPPSLGNNPYHPMNTTYAQNLARAYQEAEQFAADFEPWQVAHTKLRASGVPQAVAAKDLKKAVKTVSAFEQTIGYKRLYNHYRAIAIMRAPVQPDIRHASMWEIYIDNKEENPDIARKALNDYENMVNPKSNGSGGQVINIQINNETLPRGPLDG